MAVWKETLPSTFCTTWWMWSVSTVTEPKCSGVGLRSRRPRRCRRATMSLSRNGRDMSDRTETKTGWRRRRIRRASIQEECWRRRKLPQAGAKVERRSPVADLYRQTAFLAFWAILPHLESVSYRKLVEIVGFDSRRLHHIKTLVIIDLSKYLH